MNLGICAYRKKFLTLHEKENMKEYSFTKPLGVSLDRYLDLRDLDGEVWKPVVGYEEFFHISNMGRLKTLPRQRVTERIKMPKPNGNGYMMHDFCIGNKHKYKYIHRLVAEAFLPNPESKPEIDHKNTNRADNRLCNLEWVSHYENQINPITLANIEDGRARTPIVQLTILGEYITRWDSCTQAAMFLKVTPNAISTNVSKPHRCLTVCGYIFFNEVDFTNGRFTLPIAKSASLTVSTGIPSLNSVVAFYKNRLVDAFPSDREAAKYYEIKQATINTMCKRGISEKYKKDNLILKYFKDISSDEQLIVRRILFSKRK